MVTGIPSYIYLKNTYVDYYLSAAADNEFSTILLQCSASCGQGTQTRTLTCNKNPSDTMECDPTKKPPSEQKCIGDMCQGISAAISLVR